MSARSTIARSSRNSGPWALLIRRLLCCVLMLNLAPDLLAQSCPTGAFFQLDGAFVAANGTIGFSPENNATQIRVDSNGNGTIAPNEPLYDLPASIGGANFASASLSLSPTRRVLMAVGGQPINACTGTSLRFYRLTPGNSTPATLHEACVGVILQSRVFFDRALRYSPNAPLATTNRSIAAVLHAPSINSPTATLSLFDLESPGAPRIDIPGLRSGIGDIRVAGGGQAMYVQHDLSPMNPAGTDYSLISLCAQSFGQQANPDGSFPLRDVVGGPLDATMGPASNGTAVVTFTQLGGVFAQLNVRDCCSAVDPPAGAQLSIIQTVSPSVPIIAPGSIVTITFALGNTGGVPATGVVVEAVFLTPMTVLSVSDQGAPTTPGGSTYRWTIDTLQPLSDGGTVKSLTMTLRAECDAGDYLARAFTVRAEATNAARVTASAANAPLVVMPPTTPLTLAATLTPDSPPPLRPGDTMTLTFTLTNPGAIAQIGAKLQPALSFVGNDATLDSVVGVSSGTASITAAGLDWTFDVPAGGTASAALRLRIKDCLPPDSLAVSAQGFLLASNACGVNILSTSFSFAGFLLAQDLTTSLAAGPLSPGQIGAIVADHQPVRAGSPGVIEVRVENIGPGAAAGAFWSIALPPGIIVSNPALLPGTSPGVTYDNATRTLAFAGALAPGQASIARLNADRLADSPRATLVLQAGTDSCVRTTRTLHLCPVPTLPASALLGLDTRAGVWIFDPLIDTVPRTFFSPVFGLATPFEGFDIAPDGRLVLVGPRIILLDTQTLELSIPTTPGTSEGPLLPRDAAFDRVSGRLLLAGTLRSGFGAALGTIEPTGTTPLLADLNTVTILASVAPSASGGARVVSMPAAFTSSSQGRGVISTDMVTPITSLSAATALAMPATPFPFTPAGATLGPYPVAISPASTVGAGSDDTWALVMHRWIDGPTFLPTARTSAVSLLRIAAAGATTRVVDLVAGDVRTNVGVVPWPFDPPMTPMELSTGMGENRGASIAPGPDGSVYIASRTAVYRLDNAASGAGPLAATLVFNLPADLSGCIDLGSVGMGAPVAGCSPADIANTDGSSAATGGGPDGVIDNGDFTAFFAAFFASPGSTENLDADIANTDGDTILAGAGPDGVVDNGDFSAFFALFFAGCP